MSIRKKYFHITALLTLILLTGCASQSASNPSNAQESSEDGISLPPSNGADPTAPPADLTKAEAVKPDALPPTEALPATEAQVSSTAPAPEVTAAVAPVETRQDSGSQYNYKVKPGQTLMQVAYDVYGDIHQWRHVLELNKMKISDPAVLKKGTTLVVDQDPAEAAAHPEGTAFRIRNGDTLGLISDDVYGSKTKWKRLWDNNRKLIKNPNRIYAGFYLYYLFNEQDRMEKESFQGLQRPAMIAPPSSGQRDVSSVPSTTQAQ